MPFAATSIAAPWFRSGGPSRLGGLMGAFQGWLMHMDNWPWAGSQTAPAYGDVWMQNLLPREGGPAPQAPLPGTSSSTASAYHEPVLPAEVLHYLEPAPGKLFLDATLGGGGHSELLLNAGAQVVALDQDAEALAHARERLRGHASRFVALQGNFRHFPSLLEEAGISELDGILCDVGVSSWQLDAAQRGFSFAKDGPLDMRMDQSAGRTAADWVNDSEATELERILREYGGERQARRIVRAIVERRRIKPFSTTLDLAEVIAGVVPRHGKIHPATQTFQALRIATNDELAALSALLLEVPRWLKPGAPAVIISFHSLEDRLVKHAFAHCSTEWQDRPEWPCPKRNPDFCMRLLTRKPVEASAEEVKRNPRARSAKLRAASRLP